MPVAQPLPRLLRPGFVPVLGEQFSAAQRSGRGACGGAGGGVPGQGCGRGRLEALAVDDDLAAGEQRHPAGPQDHAVLGAQRAAGVVGGLVQAGARLVQEQVRPQRVGDVFTRQAMVRCEGQELDEGGGVPAGEGGVGTPSRRTAKRPRTRTSIIASPSSRSACWGRYSRPPPTGSADRDHAGVTERTGRLRFHDRGGTPDRCRPPWRVAAAVRPPARWGWTRGRRFPRPTSGGRSPPRRPAPGRPSATRGPGVGPIAVGGEATDLDPESEGSS